MFYRKMGEEIVEKRCTSAEGFGPSKMSPLTMEGVGLLGYDGVAQPAEEVAGVRPHDGGGERRCRGANRRCE